jgi:signal transduction histidine kinase
MSDQPAELWAFLLSATIVGGILVVVVGAAIIVAQRKLMRTVESFAARQVAATEEERRRVARELHDDVSRQIAIVSQRLEVAQGAIEGEHPDAPALLQARAAGDGLRDLAETVRAIAHRMHPSALEHLGPVPALQSPAREISMGAAWQAEVHIEDDGARLAPPVALALYRIAQEALRNVRKHVRATRVRLTLAERDGGLLLQVEDDGMGVQTVGAVTPHGLGMVSMHERARLVGGYLNVRTAPGEGTRAEAWVPLGSAGAPP